ncbi:MAG: hypothetical protein ACE5GZ_14125 [Gammaproteobacteria bacterium]
MPDVLGHIRYYGVSFNLRVVNLFVDTGAWHALVDRKDTDHQARSRLFEETAIWGNAIW